MAFAVGTDSYASVAEATTYLDNLPQDTSTWSALNETKRENWLRSATNRLDEFYVWRGEPTSSSQALLWPRKYLCTINGAILPSDTIPDRIRDATIEQAWRMFTFGSDVRDNNDLLDTGLRTLPGGLTYDGSVRRVVIFDAVRDMIPNNWIQRNHYSSGKFSYGDLIRF